MNITNEDYDFYKKELRKKIRKGVIIAWDKETDAFIKECEKRGQISEKNQKATNFR